MQWVDVAGPPGSGKSTLCDPLWGPREPAIRDIPPPDSWHDFLNEITRLMGMVRDHPSFVAAVRMNRRTVRKMATVCEMEHASTYVQAGFIQRGLGFGWRLHDMGGDLNELRHYFRLMPVSVGCVFLECGAQVVKQRNADRENVRETAHENRTFQIDHMMPVIPLARRWLEDRGVPVIGISTEEDIDEARSALTAFLANEPHKTQAYGEPGSVPAWW